MVRICEKDYDLDGNLPKVNGKVLRSNYQLCRAILDLLESVGYQFGFHHPLPAILNNYNTVPRVSLSNLLRTLVNQINDFPQSIYDVLLVTHNGFSISYDGDYPQRVCKVSFKTDKCSFVRYLTMSQVPIAVDRFFKSLSDSHTKSVIIS